MLDAPVLSVSLSESDKRYTGSCEVFAAGARDNSGSRFLIGAAASPSDALLAEETSELPDDVKVSVTSTRSTTRISKNFPLPVQDDGE